LVIPLVERSDFTSLIFFSITLFSNNSISELELENQKLTGNETEDKVVNSKIFVLKDETEFLKKVFLVVKDLKS
jgi:hypothetical protein